MLYPEKQLAKSAAIRYSSEHILDYIELQGDYAIFEVSLPEEWVGRSIGELNIRKKYHINILAVKQDGEMELRITPDTVLTKNQTLLVIGEYLLLQKCFHI